ncbi:MAG TPA: hemerythrin [Cyanobacteria bacterium UBA8803]|nr:hemerythrin [Cyanobacteria bacterium UBA9273]HBL58029.1 hemerythrin [Cyanobacteria bacterium UBA8803]
MDIFELIKQDHRQVEKLFAEIEKAKGSQKLARFFEEIEQELNLHVQVEQLTLYPAMREYEEMEKLLAEAEREHTQARILLEELKPLNPTSSEFQDKIEQLKDAVQHHVREEEEEVLPLVQQVMSDQELEQLGEEYQQAKNKLKQQMVAARS